MSRTGRRPPVRTFPIPPSPLSVAASALAVPASPFLLLLILQWRKLLTTYLRCHSNSPLLEPFLTFTTLHRTAIGCIPFRTTFPPLQPDLCSLIGLDQRPVVGKQPTNGKPPIPRSDSMAPPPKRANRAGRGVDAVEEVLRMASRCNLLGSLGTRVGALGSPFAHSLVQRAQRRAAEVWDLPRAHTALRWLIGFMTATGIQTPFEPAIGPSMEAANGRLANRMFLNAFLEFMITSPPLGASRGDHISADVAQGYAGIIRTIRCCEAGYDIAPESDNFVAPRLLRNARRGEAPRGERELSLGISAQDLTDAAGAGFDRTSEQGEVDWGAGTNALFLLLRGGEIGTRDGPLESDFRRMLVCASYLWQGRRDSSSGRLWVMVLVYAIKDVEARGRPCPGPIGRHHDGRLGDDPLCAYDAAAIVWWRRMAAPHAPFPVDASGAPTDGWWTQAEATWGLQGSPSGRSLQPMFTTKPGVPFTTQAAMQLGRRIILKAKPLADATRYGGKMWRVGGATEWRRALGDGSEAIIQKRGRWCTEIGKIYTRTLLAEQLRASLTIGSGGHQVELEALAGGWSQPGR